MDDYYFKPYIRITPYVMGIAFGLYYLKWKKGEAPKWFTGMVESIKNTN